MMVQHRFPPRFLSSLFFALCASLLMQISAQAQDANRRSPVVVAVEKASPAVVSIFSAHEVERQANPFSGNPFFEDFFRDFFEPFPQGRTERSLGSGVVIRSDGYIL